MNTLAEVGSAATVTYNNGSDIPNAMALAQQSDVAIVMVGTTPRETRDLPQSLLAGRPRNKPSADPSDECDADDAHEEGEACPVTPSSAFTDQEALVAAIACREPQYGRRAQDLGYGADAVAERRCPHSSRHGSPASMTATLWPTSFSASSTLRASCRSPSATPHARLPMRPRPSIQGSARTTDSRAAKVRQGHGHAAACRPLHGRPGGGLPVGPGQQRGTVVPVRLRPVVHDVRIQRSIRDARRSTRSRAVPC